MAIEQTQTCIDLFNGLFNSITSTCRPNHTPKLTPLVSSNTKQDVDMTYLFVGR